MSLATVSKLFMLRSVKVQWAWLAYSLSHVVIGMIVTVCQREFAHPGNTVFWSHMVRWSAVQAHVQGFVNA